jgi:hypothetical protein
MGMKYFYSSYAPLLVTHFIKNKLIHIYGKNIPTFNHASVTSTKPKFHTKTKKFVELDYNFGNACFF